MNFRFLFFWVVLVLGLGGCTTMRYADYGQVLLVRSKPSGMEIWQGDKKLGRTPKYIRVRRARHSEIELRSVDGQRFLVPLISEYRWKRSFFSNLIFLIYAPAGWLSDYLTGTAWRFRSLDTLHEDAPAQPAVARHERAAVAPPTGDNEFIADELGGKLSQRLGGEPYERTLNTFLDYQYDHDSRPTSGEMPKLYYRLQERGDTQLAMTRVNQVGPDIELKGGVHDLYSGQVIKPIDLKFPAQSLKSVSEYGWREKVSNLFYFFPNNLALEIADSNTALSLANGQSSDGHSQAADDFWEKAARYVGAIGISRVDPPTDHAVWRFRTKFVPQVALSYNRIKFDFKQVQNQTFSRFHFDVGYGPSFSYGAKYGTFELDLVPAFVWTDIRWRQGDQERAANGGRLSLGVEVGYRYFITDTWNLRFFVRNVEEDEGVWQSAFDAVAPNQSGVQDASYTYSGLSIGYRFPTGRLPLRKLFPEQP